MEEIENKILLFDLETSPNLSYTWGKWEQNVVAFKQESYIMSVAYKWYGESTVHAFCLKDFKGSSAKKQLVKRLYDLFQEADIIVAHNGDSFDIKVANRSFIYYGFKPTMPYKTVDTKKIAKSRFRFNSNSLDDLGEYLGLGRKEDTGGFQLWLDCMDGSQKAWNLMTKYNKQDVVLLDKIYTVLRPWSTKHPIVHSLHTETGLAVCPLCGGKLNRRGFYISASMIRKQQYQCMDCGKWSYDGVGRRIMDRKNIVVGT